MQVSNCVAKGWESRDFPVTLWYSLVAALKIAVKLSVNKLVLWVLADIGRRRCSRSF